MDNYIKIIKNRSDIGAGTRGADMGIDAIEVAAINAGNEYFIKYKHQEVETSNDSIYDKVKHSSAKRIHFVLEQCTRLCEVVQANIKQNYFPIVLSGDHSSALGTISAVKSSYPDKKLGVIWIDAHTDLHSPYTSLSGNVHGMPLAAVTAEDNLECKINEVATETQQHWEQIKNIGCAGRKVAPEDIVYFGVRSVDEAERRQVINHKMRNYKVDEIRFRGVTTCVNEALERVSACDVLYISFDVDSLDCDSISYGTGTPVPNGFDQYEVIEVIKTLINSGKVVCIEFAEINPLLDTKGNKMAETAFDVLDTITQHILAVRKSSTKK